MLKVRTEVYVYSFILKSKDIFREKSVRTLIAGVVLENKIMVLHRDNQFQNNFAWIYLKLLSSISISTI